MSKDSKDLNKDNSVKPFGQSVYNSTANISRKMNRTGEVHENVGRNVASHNYTTSGSSMNAAHEAAQAKEMKVKSKASVKTLKDMSPEEKSKLEEKYGAKIKKTEVCWPSVVDMFKDEDKNIKIQAALDAQGRKSALPPEVHEHLHNWWKQNKASALTPEQHERLKSAQSVKQKRAGIKMVKAIEEYEDILKGVREELFKLQKAEKPKKAPMKDWEPKIYKPEEAAAIRQFVDQGYHPREAAHLSGVETSRPGRAFKSTPLSPKMLEALKPVAKDMVKQFRDERNSKTQAHVNPDLAVAHQTRQIFDKLDNSVDSAVKEFKSSGELEKLPPHERLKALNKFKADWHAKNLESKTANMAQVAQEHAAASHSAKDAHNKHVLESMRAISQGGGGIVTPEMQASYQPETDFDTASDLGDYQDEGNDGQE